MKPHQIDDTIFTILLVLPAVCAFFYPLAAIPMIIMGTLAAYNYFNSKLHVKSRRLRDVYAPTLAFAFLMLIPALFVIIIHN